jgi:hypothetical protein
MNGPSMCSLRMDPTFAFILWSNKITQTQSEQYGNAVQYQREENPNIVAHWILYLSVYLVWPFPKPLLQYGHNPEGKD